MNAIIRLSVGAGLVLAAGAMTAAMPMTDRAMELRGGTTCYEYTVRSRAACNLQPGCTVTDTRSILTGVGTAQLVEIVESTSGSNPCFNAQVPGLTCYGDQGEVTCSGTEL